MPIMCNGTSKKWLPHSWLLHFRIFSFQYIYPMIRRISSDARFWGSILERKDFCQDFHESYVNVKPLFWRPGRIKILENFNYLEINRERVLTGFQNTVFALTYDISLLKEMIPHSLKIGPQMISHSQPSQFYRITNYRTIWWIFVDQKRHAFCVQFPLTFHRNLNISSLLKFVVSSCSRDMIDNHDALSDNCKIFSPTQNVAIFKSCVHFETPFIWFWF